MDILREVAARRDERVEDLHLDLFVPTWDGDLVARFDVLPRKEVQKFVNKNRGLESDTSFLIASTRELYLRDPSGTVSGTRMEENEEYVRLEDEDTGLPIRWDSVLAVKLGHEELTRAHDVLMYCVKDNALAVGGMAGRLITWMQNTDAEIAESLVGE